MDKYVLYKTTRASINNLFKFDCIGWYKDDRLYPYVLSSLVFINERLITDGSEDIKCRIECLEEVFKEINDLIIDDKFNDILCQIHFNPYKFDALEFTLAWSSLVTTMLIKLRYNYAHLFRPSTEEPECNCYNSNPGTPAELLDWRPINDSYEFGYETVETFDNSEYEYNKFIK